MTDKVVNYIVHRTWYDTECETEDEVWDAINESWAPFTVSSPTGRNLEQFIPF